MTFPSYNKSSQTRSEKAKNANLKLNLIIGSIISSFTYTVIQMHVFASLFEFLKFNYAIIFQILKSNSHANGQFVLMMYFDLTITKKTFKERSNNNLRQI